MKDHHTDQSDYLRHLKSVLLGEESADKDDLRLITQLSRLSKRPDYDPSRGYDRLLSEITRRKAAQEKRRHRRYITYGAVAAVIAALIVVLLPQRRTRTISTSSERLALEELRTTLLRPDSLVSALDIQLVTEDATHLHLSIADGDTLQLAEVMPLLHESDLVRLIVPKTRRSTVRLTDGTLVSLNAASSLTLHLSRPRQVTLEEGEALMEVAHDEAHPFRMTAGKMDLEVLGTTFDVCLYPERETPTATLVEGSLRVSTSSGSSVLLTPGEEALFDPSGDLTSQPANLTERTAWIEGKFVFSHLSLDSVMSYLERWYGFDTIFLDEEIKEYTYTGALSRDFSEDFIFSILQKTTRLKITHEPESHQVTVGRR